VPTKAHDSCRHLFSSRLSTLGRRRDALESAYIQLTGNPEAKESFFPEMRKRLKARGHKIADYDVLL
jgi:hypothetical protein